MSLHYHGKHEPQKLSFQLCCMLRLENDGASACYIFEIHQVILIICLDNKFVLLSTVC